MWNLWYILIAFIIALITFIVLHLTIWKGSDNSFLVAAHVIFGITSLMLSLICVFCTLQAKEELKKYNNMVEMVNVIYESENYTQYEKAGLNNKIIEINEWLAKVKASKEQYGNWSMYCVISTDGLEYLTIGGNKQWH